MKENNNLSYDQLISLNAHLIAKNKKLEQELERRNNYIAEISHRLRTPLHAIFGLTAIAKSASEDTHVLFDCLDKIDFSAHMLLNTANEILELDAVRKGNLEIHNACFDFKLMLSSISSMCNTEFGNKDIKYNVVLNGVTEDKLIGDATYLNRALMLLLMRAAKVTENGGRIKLQVSQRDFCKGFVQIQFCISDSGPALTAEEVEHYTNGDEDSDIVLVKNLCALMNGFFSFESKNGIGTLFSMTIPFGVNAAAEITTQEFLDKYRVLLVSDDPQTLDNVSAVLKRIGSECVFVPDSDKALIAILEAATMNKDFNLCLVDWGDCVQSGVEKTKAIRGAGNSKLKIAAIAASANPDLQIAARISGADKILLKPLFQSTVFNLMMELTGREYTHLTTNPKNFDFSGCKVLLAEDNELSAMITQTQLKAVGIDTDRTENGTDCLEIFRNAKANYYDLILLDMKMPYLDGCETAQAIRHLHIPGSDPIPIIALTADALNSDVSSAFEAGMNDYIVKPIDTFHMYSTLAKYLHPKGRRVELR